MGRGRKMSERSVQDELGAYKMDKGRTMWERSVQDG